MTVALGLENYFNKKATLTFAVVVAFLLVFFNDKSHNVYHSFNCANNLCDHADNFQQNISSGFHIFPYVNLLSKRGIHKQLLLQNQEPTATIMVTLRDKILSHDDSAVNGNFEHIFDYFPSMLYSVFKVLYCFGFSDVRLALSRTSDYLILNYGDIHFDEILPFSSTVIRIYIP